MASVVWGQIQPGSPESTLDIISQLQHQFPGQVIQVTPTGTVLVEDPDLVGKLGFTTEPGTAVDATTGSGFFIPTNEQIAAAGTQPPASAPGAQPPSGPSTPKTAAFISDSGLAPYNVRPGQGGTGRYLTGDADVDVYRTPWDGD